MSAPGNVRAIPDKRTDWATPPELFSALDADFGFTLDGAASAENAKCARYYDEGMDAFTQEPRGECIFINPPYGSGLDKWVELFQRWSADNTVVALLPASTDTKWFASAFESADEVRFLTPRVQFIGTTSSNPSGSVVIVWDYYRREDRARLWRWKE